MIAGLDIATILALVALYARTATELLDIWTMTDTYYAHGFFIPVVSAFLVWRDRSRLREAMGPSSAWGFLWLGAAAGLLLAGDFLGFRVAGHLSLLPMLTGLSLLWLGAPATKRVWFPIAYLVFMIPLPSSVVQSVAFELKLFAAQLAVGMANAVTLPIVQSGSSIHFGTDSLLVGDVCGGLRSLVSLLALGALVAYMSELKVWGKWTILLLAGPIAVASNVLRIFVLCVVGYFWGSEAAAGWVHDVSGVGIYVVAIALFFGALTGLQRIASKETAEEETKLDGDSRPGQLGLRAAGFGFLCVVAAAHVSILRAQAAPAVVADDSLAAIPERIVDYRQEGTDAAIDERTRAVLETSSILIRHYEAPSGRPVQLTLVRTSGTRRSLHFPEVCLIGDGWEVQSEAARGLGLALTAKRLVLVKGNQEQAVLYWFKTGERMTGSFFTNAWYWTQHQIRFESPASTMVKVATPIVGGDEASAFGALEDFAMKLMPALYEYAP